MADESNTDALLADLESRASRSDGASEVEASDDEDLEAFLARLEDDEGPSVDVATSEAKDAELAAQFAQLEDAPDAPMVESSGRSEADSKGADKTSSKSKKSSDKESKEEKGKIQAVERGESDVLRRIGQVLKWSFYVVPALLGVWLVGAFLGQWVSAGWLIFAVATVAVFGIPLGFWVATGRGGFGVWLGGVSLVSVVGLCAGLPLQSGDVLVKYGHWPASTVAEVSGLSTDHGMVRANAWFSGLLGAELAKLKGGEGGEAQRLGAGGPLSSASDEGSDEGEGVPGVESPEATESPEADEVGEESGASEESGSDDGEVQASPDPDPDPDPEPSAEPGAEEATGEGQAEADSDEDSQPADQPDETRNNAVAPQP